MTGASAMMPSAWEWMKAEDIFTSISPRASDQVFVVDVAGGRGGHMQKFLNQFPDVQLCVVNQDLPKVIDEIDPTTP